MFVYTNIWGGDLNMTISERLFLIMREKNISIPELSRRTGISRHTIFDWQRKKTNPGSDKIMVICDALQISPEELLVGDVNTFSSEEYAFSETGNFELYLIKECHNFSEAKKKRLIAYISMLENMKL